MSFQTISDVQDSDTRDVRIIAKSPHLPNSAEALLLSEAQRYVCGSEFYRYSIIEHQGRVLHILAAGTAENKHTTVHQIALSEQEVAGLQQSKARPTPAGLILAFLHKHHWVTSTTEQRNLTEEPHVASADIPDASEQKKWKELTGHKNDVRIFHAPPFDKQCLAIFPDKCTPENMLELLHESQWLTPDRGWGQVFHISNEMPHRKDVLHSGIFATNAHIADEKAYSGTPILRVAQSNRADGASAPKLMAGVTPDHYQYTECPDHDIFDIPSPAVVTRRRKILFGLSALLLTACGAITYYCIRVNTGKNEDKAISAEQMFIKAINDADYTADTRLKALEAELRKQNTAESNAMLECIRIFTEDAYSCGGHPNNMLTLLRLAEKLGMNGDTLCLSYLNKVLPSYRPEDWIRENTSTEELTEWKHLLTQSPELKKKLKYEAKYRAYMHDIILRTDKTATHHH